MTDTNRTTVTRLVCSETGEVFPAGEPAHLSSCGRPLLVEYDLDAAARLIDREALHPDAPMWQFRAVMPLPLDEEPVTLGEGGTPLLRAERLARELGHDAPLWIKDEGLNPTASFKARGLSAAVTMARSLGRDRIVIPTAGNAGGALAAYGARAGVRTLVLLPTDTPAMNKIEARACGAEVREVDGLITDCGRIARELVESEGWYDVSTLKEPYRLEGKKTMGYEIALGLGWRLPDAIVYPAGGGTGLVGMWKAFDEMARMGWIGSHRPKMFLVQSTGCAPMVRAFEEGAEEARPWEDAATVASGLRVPAAVGDRLMLRALRESGGGAIAVTDAEMVADAVRIASSIGIFTAPEGAATLSAFRALRARGDIEKDDETVLFNTGSGLKYADAFSHLA